MGDTISITVDQKKKEYKKGTTYLEISSDFKDAYASDIILASVDGRLQELNEKAEKDANVEFIQVLSLIHI